MRNLDLTFGCIDMILTPEGNYVFLEVNPNGQSVLIIPKRLIGSLLEKAD